MASFGSAPTIPPHGAGAGAPRKNRHNHATKTGREAQMIDWDAIDTVLLDMDGTLLDLHFDNYF